MLHALENIAFLDSTVYEKTLNGKPNLMSEIINHHGQKLFKNLPYSLYKGFPLRL